MILGRLNYLNKDISYYVGNIYEYDIKHAYPSILKDTNFIFEDKDLRKDIENFSKYKNKRDLLIRIGKEIKLNSNIINYINEYLLMSLEKIQKYNNLSDMNIFSIKKDALFVNKECNFLSFNKVEFSEKNRYQLYMYNYINKQEFYINKKFDTYNYSIKGMGKDVDKELCDNMCRLVYYTLINNDLELVRQLQEYFMKRDNRCLKYCPSELAYKSKIYMPKNKLIEDDMIKYVDLKEIYFVYYHNLCKCLINYLL